MRSKNKTNWNQFRGILYFLKMCWRYDKSYIIYLIIYQSCRVILTLNAIILPQYIIDATFYSRELTSVFFSVGVMGGITLITSLLISFCKKQIMIHKMLIYKEFQLSISEIMMKADYAKIESNDFLNTKSQAERFLYGDGSGFATVLESAFDLVGYTITIISLCGIIAQLNVLILVLLALVLGINTFINYRTQKRNYLINKEKSVQERRSLYFSAVTQDFRYGKEIRSAGIHGWIIDKYSLQLSSMQNFYKKLATNTFSYDVIVSLTAVVQQVSAYIYVIMCGVKGLISVGQFSMFLSAISTFSTTLKSITQILIGMQQYSQYYSAYEEYIGIGASISREGIPAPTKLETIEFQNVSFIYPGQSSFALKDINITLHAGERILLVGENGAGKSTFVNLLLRIYKPTSGKILVNGIDIQQYGAKEYSQLFSTVFQDFKLFAFPISENIALASDIDEEKILKVLKDVGLHSKINSLPNRYNTNIFREFDSKGFTPSGGEGQRIAMCRAIYKDSSVVILDEPTAALDPQAEYELYSMFDSLFSGRTAIYISHRLASAKLCSRIIVFEKGRLVEDGSHEELLNANGLYSQLFRMQADNYK